MGYTSVCRHKPENVFKLHCLVYTKLLYINNHNYQILNINLKSENPYIKKFCI